MLLVERRALERRREAAELRRVVRLLRQGKLVAPSPEFDLLWRAWFERAWPADKRELRELRDQVERLHRGVIWTEET